MYLYTLFITNENPGKADVVVSVPLLLATPNIPDEFTRKYTQS